MDHWSERTNDDPLDATAHQKLRDILDHLGLEMESPPPRLGPHHACFDDHDWVLWSGTWGAFMILAHDAVCYQIGFCPWCGEVLPGCQGTIPSL